MSRPSMSVPNQCAGEGARVRCAGASAVGSTVASQGANTPISTISVEQRAAERDGRMAAHEADEAARRLDRREEVGQLGRDGDARRHRRVGRGVQ